MIHIRDTAREHAAQMEREMIGQPHLEQREVNAFDAHGQHIAGIKTFRVAMSDPQVLYVRLKGQHYGTVRYVEKYHAEEPKIPQQ